MESRYMKDEGGWDACASISLRNEEKLLSLGPDKSEGMMDYDSKVTKEALVLNEAPYAQVNYATHNESR